VPAGDAEAILDDLLGATHLLLRLALRGVTEIHMAVRVRSDRDQARLDALEEIGPGEPVAVRDGSRTLAVHQAGGQVQDGGEAPLHQRRQHALVEVTQPVVEGDHDAPSGGCRRVERLVQGSWAIPLHDLVELPTEGSRTDLDLAAPGPHPVVEEDRQIPPSTSRRQADRDDDALRDAPGSGLEHAGGAAAPGPGALLHCDRFIH
jgi:hypothetical protein